MSVGNWNDEDLQRAEWGIAPREPRIWSGPSIVDPVDVFGGYHQAQAEREVPAAFLDALYALEAP